MSPKNVTKDISLKDFSYVKKHLESGDNVIVLFALQIIQKFKYKESVPVLTEMLKSRDDEIKTAIIKTLAQFAARETVSAVRPYLRHENDLVRCAAYESFIAAKAEPFEEIVRRMADDPSARVRSLAVKKVYSMGDKQIGSEGTGILKSILESKNDEDIVYGLEVLEQIKSEKIDIDLGFLNNLTLSANEPVKAATALVLGKLKNSASMPYLSALLKDRSLRVQNAAAKALASFGGFAIQEAVKHLYLHNQKEVEAALKTLWLINTGESKKIMYNFIAKTIERAVSDMNMIYDDKTAMSDYEFLSLALRHDLFRAIHYGFGFYEHYLDIPAVREYREFFSSSNEKLRKYAAKQIAGLGGTPISGQFSELLDNTLTLDRPFHAIRYNVTPCEETLLHPNPWVRAWTVYYTAQSPEHFSRLDAQKMVDDPDDVVRGVAKDVILLYQGKPIKEGGVKLMKDIILLKKIPLFRNLNFDQLKAVSEIMVEEKYAPCTVIFEEGDNTRDFYCIVQGKADVIKKDNAGQSIILTELGEERYFGEMALFDEHPRSATVKTREETLIYKMPREKFLEMIQEKPDIAIQICKYLSQKLREKDEKLMGRR